MFSTGLIKQATVAAFAVLFVVSMAIADRDGKGDKGGGGRGGGGDRSSARSGDHGSSRSFSSGSSDRSSRSFRSSESGRSSRGSDDNRSFSRTFRSDRDGSDRAGNRSYQFKSGGTKSQSDDRGRVYQARRPSEDQVRDFLKSGDNDRGDHDRNRGRDRNPKDRETFDREFKQWNNAWKGEKGDGRDHRDWSGNWKDSDRFDVADRIRRDWHGRRDKDRLFGSDWWKDRHHGHYWDFWGDHAHRHNRPWYWWSWATGPRLGSWITFGWPTPYYWDYGRGEYIYYDNGAIYVNGRWYEPAPVFYDQTVRIIDQGPELTADEAARLDWLPLGVFAATPDGMAEPQVMVQLAVTKEGVIGGTAFDQKSGAAYTIQGMVDKRSQRAVWSYTDDRNKRIIMETSIYNLTQPEATGLVHYGPNDMRVIELVRLQEPGSDASVPSNLPAPPAER